MKRLLEAAGNGFEAVVGERVSGFCCPLCLRILPDSCASFGHFPAKGAGGSRRTLLCKSCNNFLGATYEASSIEMARRFADEEEAGFEIDGVVLAPPEGPRIRQTAKITRDPSTGQHTFTVLPRKKANPHIESQLKAMRGKLDAGTITMPYVDGETARLGALSWAYLGLFDSFGYSFVLSPSLGRVRRVLLQGSDEHLGLGPIIHRGARPSPFELPRPVVLIRNVAPNVAATPDEIEPAPFAVGASMGKHLAVFPLADDLTASVYDLVDSWMSTGRLTENIAAMPWADAFGEDQTGPRLETVQGWTWTAGRSPVRLVRPDRARARIVLASPVRTRPLPKAMPTFDNGSKPLSLPEIVDAPQWVEAVATALEALTLVDRSATANTRKVLAFAQDSDGAEEAIQILQSSLPPAAAAHASDMYRIFIQGLSADDIDPLPGPVAHDVIAGSVRRITGQRVVAGHVQDSASGDRGIKSALLAWPRGSVTVGPAYTWQTLSVMASERVRDAVSSERLRRYSEPQR